MIRLRVLSNDKYIGILIYILTVWCGYFFMGNDKKSGYLYYMFILSISLIMVLLSDLMMNVHMSNVLLMAAVAVFGYSMAFRAQTGIDDGNYAMIFYRADDVSLLEYLSSAGVEKGYLILNYILFYLVGGDYNIAQVIIVYLSFYIIYITLKDEKKSSILIVLLLYYTNWYFLFMRAGLNRICLATSIVFYALRYVWRRDWKKFVFWILIASTIHMSSLIMLFLLLLGLRKDYIRRYWKNVQGLIFIIIPIGFVLVAKLLVPHLGARYSQYVLSGRISVSIDCFDKVPILFFGLYYLGKIPQDRKRKYIVGILLITFSCVVAVLSSLVPLGRVVFYGNLGILLIMGEIFRTKFKQSINNYIRYLVILYGVFYLMHTCFLNEYGSKHLFPYVSIFDLL